MRKSRKLCGYLELNGKELICGLFRGLNLFRSVIVSNGKRGKINSEDLCNILYDILLFIYRYERVCVIKYR